jgi:flagellar motor switch/type III secretory pathway protein FliN
MATAAEGSLARAAERRPPPERDKAGAAAAGTAQAEGAESGEDARWKPVMGLPCQLIVDLPLPGFTIADLLKLRPGSVIDAHWHVGHDVPLLLNGTLIGWIEFELVGDSLGVRLTELA